MIHALFVDLADAAVLGNPRGLARNVLASQ